MVLLPDEKAGIPLDLPSPCHLLQLYWRFLRNKSNWTEVAVPFKRTHSSQGQLSWVLSHSHLEVRQKYCLVGRVRGLVNFPKTDPGSGSKISFGLRLLQ